MNRAPDPFRDCYNYFQKIIPRTRNSQTLRSTRTTYAVRKSTPPKKESGNLDVTHRSRTNTDGTGSIGSNRAAAPTKRRVEFGPRFTFNDSHQNEMDWDDFDLERGGSKTIVTRFSDGMPTTADIVIVVDYKYFGVKGRWPFRFVGVHMDNWRWSKQPIGDVASMLDRIVEESLKKHEELRQLRERYIGKKLDHNWRGLHGPRPSLWAKLDVWSVLWSVWEHESRITSCGESGLS